MCRPHQSTVTEADQPWVSDARKALTKQLIDIQLNRTTRKAAMETVKDDYSAFTSTAELGKEWNELGQSNYTDTQAQERAKQEDTEAAQNTHSNTR